jgi:hypothetical protein
MKAITVVFGVAVAAFAAAACGEDGPDKRAGLTQREKDSILGQSQIPGAKAVKTGMTNADSASARQARLDSAEREP